MPKANSSAHTKWLCKYHIVFTPKYRRKIIYNQYKKDLAEILHDLCAYKGVEIIEGHTIAQLIRILQHFLGCSSVSHAFGGKGTWITWWQKAFFVSRVSFFANIC